MRVAAIPFSRWSSAADRVLAGETFAGVIVEVSPRGEEAEWRHSIRSIALNDERREPDCLVLVLNDVTERFSAWERFERTFNAHPAPALVCRLDDLRFVKVNQGLLEMIRRPETCPQCWAVTSPPSKPSPTSSMPPSWFAMRSQVRASPLNVSTRISRRAGIDPVKVRDRSHSSRHF